MYTKAAVLYDTRSDLIVESLLLAKPRSGEVLIKMVAAGICRKSSTCLPPAMISRSLSSVPCFLCRAARLLCVP